MHGEDAAICPIQNEKCFFVIGGEMAARAELDSGGGGLPNVEHGLGVVRMIGKIRRPTAGHRAPAEIRAAREVFHLRGSIPRRAHIKLRIGIKRERLAVRIKMDAVRIAQAGAKYFRQLPFLIKAQHVAFVGAEDFMVAAARRSVIGAVLRQLHRVPHDRVNQPIRPQRQPVASVANPARRGAQQLFLVKFSVAIRVAQPVNALRHIRVHIQPAVRVE